MISSKIIVYKSCDYLGVSLEKIRNEKFVRNTSYARQITAYLIKEISNESSKETGNLLGITNTVVDKYFAIVKVRLRFDKKTKNDVKNITELCFNEVGMTSYEAFLISKKNEIENELKRIAV